MDIHGRKGIFSDKCCMCAALQTLWSIFNGFMLPYPTVRHSFTCNSVNFSLACVLQLCLLSWCSTDLLAVVSCRCQQAGR